MANRREAQSKSGVDLETQFRIIPVFNDDTQALFVVLQDLLQTIAAVWGRSFGFTKIRGGGNVNKRQCKEGISEKSML